MPTLGSRLARFCHGAPALLLNLERNSRSAGFSSAKGLRAECPSHISICRKQGAHPSTITPNAHLARDAAHSHPINLEWPSTPTRPHRVQTMYDPLFVSRSICSLQGPGGRSALERTLCSSRQGRVSFRRRAELQ